MKVGRRCAGEFHPLARVARPGVGVVGERVEDEDSAGAALEISVTRAVDPGLEYVGARVHRDRRSTSGLDRRRIDAGVQRNDVADGGWQRVVRVQSGDGRLWISREWIRLLRRAGREARP